MAEVKDVIARHKIQMQLGIPFFLVVGFFIAVVVFGALYFSNVFQSDSSSSDVESIAQKTANTTEAFLNQMSGSSLDVTNFLAANIGEDVLEEGLRQLLSQNKLLVSVRWYDNAGSTLGELHKSRASDALLEYLSSGSNFTSIVSRSNDSTAFILDGIGHLHIATLHSGGLVVSSFESSDLENIINGYALNSAGNIQIAQRNTLTQLISFNYINESISDERPSDADIAALVESDRRKYGFVTEDGLKFRGHWVPVRNTNWLVLAEIPFVEAPETDSGVFYIAGIVLLIFVALVLYYMYVFNRKLIRPLRNIEKVMHYFETGDYSEQMDVGVKNELAEIAALMNKMSHHIENNTSERVSQLKKVLDRQNTDTRLLIEKDVELREKGQKLKELDAAKSMFVSVAAHQMRTPLAAIKWALKLVMDGDVGPVNAEQKEYLNKGYESTTRMINLINDLLDVDKIESDKFSYTFKDENLVGIIQGIIDDLTPISNEKGVNLKFQNEVGTDAPLNADQVKLRNALQNLIDNAIKYTIGGGDVTVRLLADAKIFKLSIQDTGIGIPVSEQGKVFGKFFRAKNAVRQETDGSGLGLFIVKKIIEKHGGSITFESKEGKGTTFNIELPIQNK